MKRSRSKPVIPSKFGEKKKDDKEQENEVKDDQDEKENNPIDNFGIRQRRVGNNGNNNDNNNNMNGGNNVNQVNQDMNNNNNINNNNNNVFANNAINRANIAVRETFFRRLFRLLNVNVLIRLGICMWLFGPSYVCSIIFFDNSNICGL